MKNNKSENNNIKLGPKNDWNLANQIRKNLQAGLKERYGDHKPEQSSK